MTGTAAVTPGRHPYEIGATHVAILNAHAGEH